MRGANSIKDQSLIKRLLPCTLHILLPIPLLPIILLSLYFYPFSLPSSPPTKLSPPSSTSTPLLPSAEEILVFLYQDPPDLLLSSFFSMQEFQHKIEPCALYGPHFNVQFEGA
ncbi:hypothetical protein DEO72_LG4g1553 [Vigna unguiculata]|uniref:Uncharacterized protein n=1 Tax=Vigna unguiculata TaxID=3917 RepID=A0A4D6LR75_VIGUN|nr:hypothetical protein DEO72_LG4g1553 [Vigna unguiculata]